MNKLIIIDKDVNLLELSKLIKIKTEKISLFSLTSDFLVINKIKNHLQAFTGHEVNIIESAVLINDEVTVMQKTIHAWSADLGNYRMGHKNLKEWFMLPDGAGTAWWFGLVSEKNSVQDDVFFKIAQMNAIKKWTKKNHYDACVISIANKKMRKIIIKITSAVINQIFLAAPCRVNGSGCREKIMKFMQAQGIVGALFFSLIQWIVWLRDSRLARNTLPPLQERMTKDHSFLFITYFPNIDEALAKKGHFHNKYGIALQHKLAALSMPITWLLMPVWYNGHDFRSAMKLAADFSRHGEKLFVLQEFFSLPIFLRSFFWWIKQGILSVILWIFLDKKKITSGLTDIACLPLIKYLWQHSFLGTSGVRGTIFYLTFLNMFKTLTHINKGLYYCEMQAWEKALILAKKKVSPGTQLIAFQHTVVMRNYFNYFYDERETCRTGKAYDMPLPDKLLANGRLMHRLLAESNYPGLMEAEAVRQLYLTTIKENDQPVSLSRKPVLLVVGSCDRTETKALITLVYAAFPKAKMHEIWFKGSPVNPVAPLFSDLGILIRDTHYRIVYDDIASLLANAAIALVPNTTVAIEAIAFNCHLFVPIFADTMLMNPVIETKADYLLVSNPHELNLSVNHVLQCNAIKDKQKAREVIENYWHIDPQLPLWTTILADDATN